MAAGDFGMGVLKATAGIMSEIDPKSTLKFMTKDALKDASKNSKAFKAGAKATKFLAGGIRDTIKGVMHDEGFAKSLSNAHKHTVKVATAEMAAKTGKQIGEEVTKYSGTKIAGTVMGLSMAGRIVTCGGLYRDKNGNTNLPGIPFV